MKCVCAIRLSCVRESDADLIHHTVWIPRQVQIQELVLQEKVDQLQDTDFVQKFAEAQPLPLSSLGRPCDFRRCHVQVDFVQKARDAANQAGTS